METDFYADRTGAMTSDAYSRQDNFWRLTIRNETRDFVAFTLWIGATFVQFRFDELLLYPLTLYFIYATWMKQSKVVPLAARAWIVFLFPVWCLLTVMWANVPMEALKYAIYLFLTILICVYAAAMLPPRKIMHAVLLATGTIAVISLFVGIRDNNIDVGIFSQKNTMGKSMVILWTAAVATAIDSGSPFRFRLAGLALAGLSAFLAVASDSATAILLVLGTGAVLAGGAVILQGGFLRASRLALSFLSVGAAATAASLILPMMRIAPVQMVLDEFGKDSTLTGRTILWQYAERQIDEAPLLGIGAGGFWRYWESPLVRRIYEEFHKFPNDIFNFHNSFYEIAVHQGLIGAAIAGLAALWAFLWLVRGTVYLATLPHIFFLAQGLAMLARTITESDFLKPFVLFHMIFWIGAVIALRQLVRPAEGVPSKRRPALAAE